MTIFEITNAEKRVWAQVAQGKSNAEAAKALGISVNTVGTHIKLVYEKLGVVNRTEAAIEYLRRIEGIINIPSCYGSAQ